MEFPIALRNAVELKVEGIKQEQLKKTSLLISERYRNESGTGKRLVTTETEAAIYSLVRMPATFGAVTEALSYAIATNDLTFDSLLDVGAGTGAASWAAESLLSLKSITCLERETSMREWGKQLMNEGAPELQSAQWLEADLLRDRLDLKADLVISSYVLNEMSQADRKAVIEKLWNCANKMLLIIEPGTPVGYNLLKDTREMLLEQGAFIAAPCPHTQICRLRKDDWCHFTTRVQRSRMHKLVKSGDVPYEDEKFSYVAFTRTPNRVIDGRILRHPYIEKGQITLDVCTEFENKKITITKRDGDLFKKAKKVKCGDEIEFE